MDTVKRWVAAWVWEEEMDRQSTEDFQGNENVLRDVMMDTSHYTFVQTHRTYSTNSGPFPMETTAFGRL